MTISISYFGLNVFASFFSSSCVTCDWLIITLIMRSINNVTCCDGFISLK